MSRPKRDRRMLITSVTTDDLAQRISGALHREFGELACAVKRIAGAMRPPADPRAVRNWWEAKNPPSAAQMMRLSQVSLQVRLELLAIIAGQQGQNELKLQEAYRRDETLVQATNRIGDTRVAPQTPGCPPRSDHDDHCPA